MSPFRSGGQVGRCRLLPQCKEGPKMVFCYKSDDRFSTRDLGVVVNFSNPPLFFWSVCSPKRQLTQTGLIKWSVLFKLSSIFGVSYRSWHKFEFDCEAQISNNFGFSFSKRTLKLILQVCAFAKLGRSNTDVGHTRECTTSRGQYQSPARRRPI